ncbi:MULTISPECIES: hypothetical protein [unclassified Myroides]|uniref:hypothetical protein n=1 Tax=unclassified Myroides TaxID=2642485 RepID=UPI0031017F35
MNIVLWIIVSIAFLGSVLMFIPSVMSLGAPVFKAANNKQKIQFFVSRTFLYLVLAYPVVFFFSIIGYRFFDVSVLPFLLVYLSIVLLLFLAWRKSS